MEDWNKIGNTNNVVRNTNKTLDERAIYPTILEYGWHKNVTCDYISTRARTFYLHDPRESQTYMNSRADSG